MIVKMVVCAVALWLAPVPSAARESPKPEGTKKVQSAKDTRGAKDAQQSQEVDLLAIEAHIVSYTNAERTKHGLAPLKVDQKLMRSARRHAAWMARNSSLVHTREPVAENIAMGQPHSSVAVRDWMSSPGHRANILSRSYGRIGVAAYRTARGTIFWCQQFRR
jgi:uncharacterized protein YkwD